MANEIFSTGDAQGNAAACPPFATMVDDVDLPANTAVEVKWRDGYDFCLIAGAADYWGRIGGDAAIPTPGGGGVSDGTGSVFRPAARRRTDKMAKFSLISATAQVVSVEWYKRQS